MLRRLILNIPLLKGIRHIILCDNDVYHELIDTTLEEKMRNRIFDWVSQQKSKGLSNLNIWHKFFYYNFAIATKYGYYSTFNNTIPSIATYMNPLFLREILRWDSRLLIGKKIQFELIAMLGNLSSIRSQTVDLSIRDSVKKNKANYVKLHKMINVFERAIRGGAMVYTDWYDEKYLRQYLGKICNDGIGSKIHIRDKAWFNNNQDVVYGLIKVLTIENFIRKESVINKDLGL